MEKVIGYIADTAGAMAGVVVFVMGMVVGLAAILRYAFNFIILSVDEFSAYGLIFIVFLASGYVLKQGGHININIVSNRLPTKPRLGLQSITCLFGLYVAAEYSRFAWNYFLDSVRLHRISISVAAFPLGIIHSFVWIGWLILAMVLIIYTIKTFRNFWESLRGGPEAGAGESKRKVPTEM